MKLSNNTIKILQNFSGIHQNIVLESGKVVKTISEAKNIFASAEIAEEFDSPLGIYDLNEFLSALNLIDSPDLEFNGKVLHIKSTTDTSGLKYACANPSILTTPKKDIKDPDYEVTFDLTQSVITQIKKAAAVLKYENFSFVSEVGSTDICVTVSDPNNSSSNTFSEVIGQVEEDTEFNFKFVISNLRLMPDDYEVNLSSRLISRWVAKTVPVKYWIAIEEGSNYSPC